MKYFNLHILRGIRKNFATYLGAILIIALGVFICVSMIETMFNLETKIHYYYEKNQLGDIFAKVSCIPEEKLKDLEKIEGIDRVSGILSKEIRLIQEDMDTIVSVHLMGYDETQILNQIGFTENSYFINDTLYLGKKMMRVRNYQIGQKISLIISGQIEEFTLAGSIYAPQYIYALPPSGAIVTDGSDYDIALISKDKLENLLGSQNVVNELSFRLQKDVKYEEVKDRLREELSHYGLFSLIDYKNHTSYSMVESEIGELRSAGTVVPIIFMLMSVFMLYIVLKKNIDNDRMLIGTMKALGMNNAELMATYIFQAICIGLLGNILGLSLAGILGKYFFEIYANLFTIPSNQYLYFWNLRIMVLGISILFCLLAVYIGVKDIIKIQPSEAMRSPSPTIRIGGSWIQLFTNDTMIKMGLRSIYRSPFRTMVIAMAVAFPFGMSVSLFSFIPSINQLFDSFDKVQRYDLKLHMEGYAPLHRGQVLGLAFKGVESTEGIMEILIQLENENQHTYATLYGLHKESPRYKIYSDEGRYLEPSSYGLIINSRIARKIGVNIGDTVEVKVLGSSMQEKSVKIMDIIQETSGGGAYIDIKSVKNILGIPAPINAVLLNVRRGEIEKVKEEIKNTKTVLAVTDIKNIIAQYHKQFNSSKLLIDIFIYMSMLAGVVLIYNILLISIRERSHEFATLKILGISISELRKMILVEEIIYMILGVVFGIPIAYLIKNILENMIDPEDFTFTIHLSASAYTRAFMVCFIITAFTTISVMRYIQKIPAVDSLKERN